MRDAAIIDIDESTTPSPPSPPPRRVARFVQRVARLQPGKYVLTLTITEERAFWTIQELNRVEA